MCKSILAGKSRTRGQDGYVNNIYGFVGREEMGTSRNFRC